MATEFPDAVHRGQPARRQSGAERGEMFLERQMEDSQSRPQGFFHHPRLPPPCGATGANTKAVTSDAGNIWVSPQDALCCKYTVTFFT